MQESFSHDIAIRQFLALSSRYFLDGRTSFAEEPRQPAGAESFAPQGSEPAARVGAAIEALHEPKPSC